MDMPYSSRTVQLSSLDPPGTQRKLTIPFAFTKQRPDRCKLLKAFPHMKPFDTLPRLLIPSSRYAWRPPRMFYAWPAPQKTMLDFAKKHKLVKRARGGINLHWTLRRALCAMIRTDDLAQDISPDFLYLRGSLVGAKDGITLLVALYSNYDVKRGDILSDETVEKIRERLGVEGRPKWYLDCCDGIWEER
ncbi:uncharacterized protein B0H18DRAFT_1034433 [Fomitopsis serialis]|uniref:uncharacterized protein n=1 Tax=Fomitopsis serialis TaxID=139415 RepID=UPI00200753A6|nr:uncharacterized protein B0H18DRAFT_1034433 [Neoantrodia serialis]KAH9917513.1 hypothetical protein B0H18DRAFT_1034433 [Neoantrodia serialis]